MSIIDAPPLDWYEPTPPAPAFHAIECAWCGKPRDTDHTLCRECQTALAAEDAYARSTA